MKTKMLLIPAVVGMFMMVSCKKGPSEETTKALAEFETAWGELGTAATAWSADLKGTVDNCTACCAKHEGASMDGVAEEMKAKCTETMTACANDKAAFEGMWGAWTEFQASWEADSKAFGEWKEKVAKGEVDEEAAKAGLADWTTKMTDAKSKVEGWNTAYTAAKESCMKNMENCAALEKEMMDAAAKAPAKKG